MAPSKEKPPVPVPPPGDADVRLELERILASSVFRGSRRCQDFLSFVVSRALDGDADSLKERTLAIEIFGRSVGADLTDDSIVRVGAREVRKRLAQYYVTDGANDSVRIELPAGSYVPSFQPHSQEPPVRETAPETVAEVLPAPPAANGDAPLRWRRVPLWAPVASVILLCSIPLLIWQWVHRAPSEFQSFWQPAFDQQGPLLLVMAHPQVYHPSTNPSRPNGSDFVPALDQYAGFGDTIAAVRLAALFAVHSHQARVRLASKVDYADMRDSATVLIGAFTNRWTVQMTQKFRYHFAPEDDRHPAIVDMATGTRRWSLETNDNGKSNEDFILICRVPRSESGGFAIIGAGLTQYGTEEAGRILAESDALAPLLRNLPGDWASKNIELVLHTQIVDDTPTSPELIASHVW